MAAPGAAGQAGMARPGDGRRPRQFVPRPDAARARFAERCRAVDIKGDDRSLCYEHRAPRKTPRLLGLRAPAPPCPARGRREAAAHARSPSRCGGQPGARGISLLRAPDRRGPGLRRRAAMNDAPPDHTHSRDGFHAALACAFDPPSPGVNGTAGAARRANPSGHAPVPGKTGPLRYHPPRSVASARVHLASEKPPALGIRAEQDHARDEDRASGHGSEMPEKKKVAGPEGPATRSLCEPEVGDYARRRRRPARPAMPARARAPGVGTVVPSSSQMS